MTKKDYVLMVAALRAVRDQSEGAAVNYADICRQLAAVLQRDNPRFSLTKFLSACGVSVDTGEV
jgi:hypothetical protein